MKAFLSSLAVAAALASGAASAVPTNFSFTGNLDGDNAYQTFAFSVAADSNVTMRTWSWAGGTNAAGQSIAAGGFDPILSVFNATTGIKVGDNDDGGCGLVAQYDTVCWDTYLDLSLSAGDYVVAVSQFSNFAGGTLDAPFTGQGLENFNGRTSFWAFDILNVEDATIPGQVPEPGSLALLGLGLAGIAALRRRKQS